MLQQILLLCFCACLPLVHCLLCTGFAGLPPAQCRSNVVLNLPSPGDLQRGSWHRWLLCQSDHAGPGEIIELINQCFIIRMCFFILYLHTGLHQLCKAARSCYTLMFIEVVTVKTTSCVLFSCMIRGASEGASDECASSAGSPPHSSMLTFFQHNSI